MTAEVSGYAIMRRAHYRENEPLAACVEQVMPEIGRHLARLKPNCMKIKDFDKKV